MSDFKNSAFATFLRKNNICPICLVKKALNTGKVNLNGADEYINGAADTPPMGWASWNLFHSKINEDLIYEMAQAMHKAGLDKYGYTYVNIDDCWMSSFRDKDGRLQGDLSTFPHGMKALVEKINACGFKAGIYTSNGTLTCQDLPSSLYHERTDAQTFAEWGFEYFKYDFCHNKAIPTAAPDIAGLEISAGSELLCAKTAEDAALQGTAELFRGDKYRDCEYYIGGLSADMGKAYFTGVEVPEDGEYTLTLIVHKSVSKAKFIRVCVNGTDFYETTVPETNAHTGLGRHQLRVRLKKGENTVLLSNPIGSRAASAAKQYRDMGYELKRAAEEQAKKENREVKPICYSICEWGMNFPWHWGATAGNLWRTTPDIRPEWLSVLGVYERNVRLAKYAGKGHYNDPDMLEVGNGSLTETENRTHFTLWCMMASPLILGNDIRKLLLPDGTPDQSNKIYRIITNRDAIAIDQDALCIQCTRVKTNGLTDVLLKPLTDHRIAVCLFNKTGKDADIAFDVNDFLGMPEVTLEYGEKYRVRDVWDSTDFVSAGSISQSVPGHGVKLYIIEGMKAYE